MTIEAYLETIKERFVTDPLVTSFQTIRERSTLVDGHLRARLGLSDGSQLEFSEYVQRSSTGEIVVITYSYHWADADNQFIKRWGNTPHFPDLPGFPDHMHDGVTDQVTTGQPMSILAVLDEIAKLMQELRSTGQTPGCQGVDVSIGADGMGHSNREEGGC